MGIYAEGSWRVEMSISVITLVLLVGYWLKRKSEYFKDMGIPYLPMWPSFVLSMKMFTFRISIIDFVHEMYHKLDGHKIAGYFQGTSTVLMVRDPDLANRILIKDFSYFHDHGFQADTEVNPLEGHLFNMEGQKWRTLRSKLTPTFTSGKLKWMLPQIAECADQLVQLLQEKSDGEDVLIRDYLSRFSIDVIGSCAFGLESGALKDPDCEFRRIAKRIFRPSGLMKVKAVLRLFFPKVVIWLKMKVVDPEVNDFFFNITRQAFEHRLKTGLKRNDFLDLLLQLKQKGWVDCDPKELSEDKEEEGAEVAQVEPESETVKLELTDGLLAAQSFIFLVAGWENTATLISFCLLMFSRNPEAQDKVREEIAAVKKKHSGEISYSALKDMIYLDACISETLRLHSPAAALFHSSTKDYTLEDGVVIKKGTPVIVPTNSMQLDPLYFHDPEQFIPERFIPESEITKKVFIPFGAGPRICIARRFVLLEVKLVLAKLLENFRVLRSPKVKEPLKIEPSFTIMDLKGGIWLRLQKVQD